MRINSGRRPRSLVRALHTAALVTLTGSILTACQDHATSPTSAGDGSESAIEFDVTPEGAAEAQGATMRGLHKLPILSLREKAAEGFSASVAMVDNSPFDLTYFGGPVLTGATSYVVAVNCVLPDTPATCWGTGFLSPTTFLRDLNQSDYIRLANEYISVDAKNKFPAVGMRTQKTFTAANHATLQEVLNIVADAATRTGQSGYGAIYHVFLPQGTSMCIAAGNCYSPNDPASWTFCAFHGSVNLASNRHVLFTVQPYQGVDGCRLASQTPNGLIDATASTLAHELFETITDPDLDGWSNALFGYEISDMCFAFGSNRLMNGHRYFLQAEYSNRLHMCTSRPPAV
jgi:hypothetical protein